MFLQQKTQDAVRKIRIENFPAFIIVDDKGNDFFADFKH